MALPQVRRTIAIYPFRTPISHPHTIHQPPDPQKKVAYIVHFARVLAGSEAEADRVVRLVEVGKLHQCFCDPRGGGACTTIRYEKAPAPKITHEPKQNEQLWGKTGVFSEAFITPLQAAAQGQPPNDGRPPPSPPLIPAPIPLHLQPPGCVKVEDHAAFVAPTGGAAGQ